MRLHFAAGVPAADRAAIRSEFQAGRPAARRIISRLGPRLTFKTAGGSLSRVDSLFWRQQEAPGGAITVTMARRHLHSVPRRLRVHLLWHELGHAIDAAGLDSHADRRFSAAFRRSSAWRGCWPLKLHVYAGRRCVPEEEIFADQAAFWATGDRNVRSGYWIPPLASAREFWGILRREYLPGP